MPPHILLIHSDQHRFDCLGANGHPLVRTPNLDRLADAGVNFTHAFTPNPVCSPARACLQTGTWATTHRCVTIPGTEAFRPADPRLPVLTQRLHEAGYRVGHVGKFHAELAGGPTDYGADCYVPTHGYDDWRERRGLAPRPREHGLYGEVDHGGDAGHSRLAWQCDRVLAMLDAFADGEAPLFIRWDPPEPHLPNVVPEPYASMYDLEDIEPWPSFPDPLLNKPEVQRRTRQRWGTDDWSWSQWRPVVRRYLGEITLLDHQVGRLLDRLDELGIAEETLVIYSTDHGDMCGGHGMMDKHFVMYDDVVRVPLILRWPGVFERGGTCDQFVTHELDLGRTILGAAGLEPPRSFVGHDLRDLVAGRTTRDAAFAQYQGTHQGLFSQRMLRDRRFKYVYNPVAIDELYDLAEDPGELHNLADAPGYRGTLHAMRERMARCMEEIGDPLSTPWFDWGRSRLPADHPASPPLRAGADP